MPRSTFQSSVSLILMALAVLWAPPQAVAQTNDIPAWLMRHVGTSEGQIAPVVLQRARALYERKKAKGAVKNACYLAKDATRPSVVNGQPGKRFYIICERSKTFRAVSSGYGNGRKLKAANFSNGRQCARNFSNAEGSKLTMGGAYTTAETRTSFKGYLKKGSTRKPFYRTFLLFDGEGETRNARDRAIGGHPAVFVKWQCRFKNPSSPHADKEGYTPYGKLVDYTSGRSNGCTTWSQTVSREIMSLVENNPTTLYIYPEGDDIDAVAKTVKKGQSMSAKGLYWNAACLKSIGAPKFWPKRKLQPIINKWRRSLPKQSPRVLPVCK